MEVPMNAEIKRFISDPQKAQELTTAVILAEETNEEIEIEINGRKVHLVQIGKEEK